MSASKTPLTDALHVALVKASEDQRTWIAGKDYVTMHDHARALESDHRAMREALLKAADTLRDIKVTFDLLGKQHAAMAASIAEEATRSVLAGLKVKG